MAVSDTAQTAPHDDTPASAEPDLDACRRHLDLVWGAHRWPAGSPLLTCGLYSTADGERRLGRLEEFPHTTDQLDRIARSCISQASLKRDVWITVGVHNDGWRPPISPKTGRPNRRSRGGATDIAAVPALVIDVDIQGIGEHKVEASTLPTVAQAEELMARIETHIGCRFGVVVHTGGGMHGWLLLDQPYRRPAGGWPNSLLERWKRYCHGLALEMGVHLDAVGGDAARILRPAGTINGKGATPLPVRLLRGVDERISVARLEALLPAIAPTPTRREPRITPLGVGTPCDGRVLASWQRRLHDRFNATADVEALLELGGLAACGDGWTHPGYSDGVQRVELLDDGRLAFRGSNTAAYYFGSHHSGRVHYDLIGVFAWRYCGGDFDLARRCILLARGETTESIAWSLLPADAVRRASQPLMPAWYLPHADPA